MFRTSMWLTGSRFPGSIGQGFHKSPTEGIYAGWVTGCYLDQGEDLIEHSTELTGVTLGPDQSWSLPLCLWALGWLLSLVRWLGPGNMPYNRGVW